MEEATAARAVALAAATRFTLLMCSKNIIKYKCMQIVKQEVEKSVAFLANLL